MNLRPGEIDKVIINYAPWSVPLGGLGIVTGGTSIDIVKDTASCASNVQDGFAPPTAPALSLTTPLNTAVAANVTAGVTPAGNTFSFAIVPLSGPFHGGVVDTSPVGDGNFQYTPNPGFIGYDEFWVQTIDAQGRKVASAVVVAIGAPTSPAPPAFSGLYIDRTKIQVDTRFQTVTFPVALFPDARECERFRINIRQNARDCDNTYSHLMCIDVYVGKC